MSTAPAGGRTKLILIALVFILPLAAAAWLYFGKLGLQPVGRTNHGELLEPFVSLNELPEIPPINTLAGGAIDGQWILIYADTAACGDACRAALYRMRQSRLMLGNDMTRLARIFLHGDIGPDTVWLDEQHEGLITISNVGLIDLLNLRRPGESEPQGLFLVDPLGNLVMYFAHDLPPGEMVSDIEHLLELSRIG